ncbi:MAG: D-2-hydroxyacid dehydrogenase [Flavobacteriales bacterium]|jgi:D-3-phosphoglycerate dehydrogenase|nr:D-2-hydroxyacid dehydrogenase [Flavobacteriales bacterium]MCB0757065.1 D-2-hydroxyacid dehydrogenase [Flavobacteriales bacterium]
MRIHANDGISDEAKSLLQEQDFKITTHHVPQDKLVDYINAEGVDALLVRSATKVPKELIDACPGLKLIGRGGVGMDNIDVVHAEEKGLRVINTPASSSISVAELVMGHLFNLMRDMYKANRRMPSEGGTAFKEMKKEYGSGTELRGKTLGILGFGRIGRWVACYALGAGMKVIYTDNNATVDYVEMEFNGSPCRVGVKMVGMDELLSKSDAITVHVGSKGNSKIALGAEEFAKMKPGMVLVNTARGNSIDEQALIAALKDGRVKAAGLDVFMDEPTPHAELLSLPNVCLSPHIGAATVEAQARVGNELAELLIAWRDEVTVGRG